MMQRFIYSFVLMISFISLKAKEKQRVYFTNTKFLQEVSSPNPIKYTYEVYSLPNQTYAYVIFANSKRYLHQQNMPGKPLTQGFDTKEAAEKVAKLVIKKLEVPISLPRVSTIEMAHLQIM